MRTPLKPAPQLPAEMAAAGVTITRKGGRYYGHFMGHTTQTGYKTLDELIAFINHTPGYQLKRLGKI